MVYEQEAGSIKSRAAMICYGFNHFVGPKEFESRIFPSILFLRLILRIYTFLSSP